MTLFMAVGALLVEEEWAHHLAVRTRTILHVVALVDRRRLLGIEADLAEGGLGSSLVASMAFGAGIAARVVVGSCVHRCSEIDIG